MDSSENELDFNSSDYSSFFYTNEKQIVKMDDQYVISKIIEKYPDFSISKKDSVLKQAFIVFLHDSKHVNSILESFEISIDDLFKMIYRNYSFLFNTCFINKVHDIIRLKSYVKARKHRRA